MDIRVREPSNEWGERMDFDTEIVVRLYWRGEFPAYFNGKNEYLIRSEGGPRKPAELPKIREHDEDFFL